MSTHQEALNRNGYLCVNGLYVRRASQVGRDTLRLELSPSEKTTADFLKHINQLGQTDSITVEVPLEMLERISSPEEMGSREHKIAALPGGCVNMRFALQHDAKHKPFIQVFSLENDATYMVSGDSDSGFRPTVRFGRLFKEDVRAVAAEHLFHHIREFFGSNQNYLLPKLGAPTPLEAYQKDLLHVMSPYAAMQCLQPEEATDRGHARLEGNYLTIEQRSNSFADIVEAEKVFEKVQPNSVIHGKVSLSDMIGNRSKEQWLNQFGAKLDETLSQTKRMHAALLGLDEYITTKLPLKVANLWEQEKGSPLSPEQHQELTDKMQAVFAQISADSAQHLKPLNEFVATIKGRQEPANIGLAVMDFLGKDAPWGHQDSANKPAYILTLSDGTEINFRDELAKVVSDPRNFGVDSPLDNKQSLQATCQAAVMNHISRSLISTYWGIHDPEPCTDALLALQNENEHKVTDRFTKIKNPYSDPTTIYQQFDAARDLLLAQTGSFMSVKTLGHPEQQRSIPPKGIMDKLVEAGSEIPEITASRGVLLRNACSLFSRHEVSLEALDTLLKEASSITGHGYEEYQKEVTFLNEEHSLPMGTAIATLLLHEAIATNNSRLAAKLDDFGKKHLAGFGKEMENALDSRIRPQALTTAGLAQMASSGSYSEVVAATADARQRGEATSMRTTAVAVAAVKALQASVLQSMEFFKHSLPSNMAYKNIESYVYSGPQSLKVVKEIVEQQGHEQLASFFQLASIPDVEQRKQVLDAHEQRLTERATAAHEAVEVEADARCYPGGRSPKRLAKEQLKNAMNKAFHGLSKGGDIDPMLFAPPSLA